jgi:hypothetical protein
MPPQELKEWVTLIKDILLGTGALTTICLSVYGVRVWKRDLVGKESYASVRELIKHLHMVSRVAHKMRGPAYEHEKRSLSEDEQKFFTQGEQWRMLEAEVYRKRIDDLDKEIQEFDAAQLEVRVLLGSHTQKDLLPFRQKIRECIERVNDYLDLLQDQTRGFTEDSPAIQIAQEAMYPAQDLDDPLSLKVANTREAAEISLLKYIHRKRIQK